MTHADWPEAIAALDEAAERLERLEQAMRGQAQRNARLRAEVAAVIDALDMTVAEHTSIHFADTHEAAEDRGASDHA